MDNNKKANIDDKKNNKLIFSVVGVCCVVLLGLGIFLITGGFGGTEEETTETEAFEETTQQVFNPDINPLTGEGGYIPSLISSRPIAVVVNNAPPARPQWGLTTPDIVMEFEVEGGASRMMWLYARAEDLPEKLGSVRSARHYFVEMSEAFDALFIHWGGSTFAYDLLSRIGTDNVDGITYSTKYFSRDTSRGVATEHTGYTTAQNIINSIQDLNLRTDIKDKYLTPFRFSSEASLRELEGNECNSIKALFSSGYYHTFKYNAEDSRYYNWMNTEEMVDDKGVQMAVENVFVLYSKITSMNTSQGHVTMDYDLGGTGLYANNGKVEEIKWTKGDTYDSLKLYDTEGKELIINPGKSWIGFIRSENASKTVIE